jgi:hypothetical protein
VRVAEEETLDSGVPISYPSDMYERKASAVFEHSYERYGAQA